MIIIAVVAIWITSCNQQTTTQKSGSSTETMTVSDSIAMFTNLIASDSTDFKLYLDRARLYLNNGQLDPAFRDVNLAIEINKNDATAYVILADLYFIIGKADNSTTSLKKALELDPENLSIVLKLARTYLMLRDYDISSQYIDYAISLDVDNHEAYYLRGVRNLEAGDTTMAILDLQIAGNLDPTFYVAFMHAGAILSIQKDSAAIDAFKSAVQSKPGDEKSQYLLAVAYQDNGNFEPAMETYGKLSKEFPDNSRALFNMGYIYLVENQDADEAIILFQQAIVVAPSYYEAVYNLGRAYELKGMYEEARIQYRQALKLRTNYPLAIEALNRLDEIKQ